MTSRPNPTRRRRRSRSGGLTRRAERIASAFGLLIALFGLVPAMLVAVSRARFGSASPLAGVRSVSDWDLAEIRRAASEPLSDSSVVDLLIRSCLVLIWIAIAVMVITTLAEVAHMVRHHGIALPAVRGLGWAQPAARLIAVGLMAIAPLHTPRVSLASTTGGSAGYEMLPRVSAGVASGGPAVGTPVAPSADETPPEDDLVHVVRRGESVYSIASELAGGDAARTASIAAAVLDANLGHTMAGGARFTNPAYVEIGWQLIIPAGLVPNTDPTPRVATGSTVHVVAPGDTLSGIAEVHLGDADAWPTIWEENAGDAMGAGRTFDDPHLILPGWQIDVPDPQPTNGDPPEQPGTDPDPVDGFESDGPGETDPDPLGDGAEQPATTPLDSAVLIEVADTSPPPGEPPAAVVPSIERDGVDVSEPAPTTTTAAGSGSTAEPDAVDDADLAPSSPSPIRVEQAAMLAGGVLALLAVRRRQRLRSALPRSRVPEPRSAASAMERRLRLVDPGERSQRVDVALRAAASNLVGAGVQVGLVIVGADGTVVLQLTGDAELPAPWVGTGSRWEFPAATPIEIIGEAARLVGTPCVALAQIGVSPDGCDVLVDLEACPTLLVEGADHVTDPIIAGLATSLAASPYAEVAHLVSVSLERAALLDHRNAHATRSADEALELATSLIGASREDLESSFVLRSVRTGGEVWEPAVVLLRESDGVTEIGATSIAPGSGIAIVAAVDDADIDISGCRLRATDRCWSFEGFGTSVALAPVGLSARELDDIAQLLGAASEPLEQPETVQLEQTGATTSAIGIETDPFVAMPHAIVVGLLGEVRVIDAMGNVGTFERSKTVELIAWLTTHRERSTRTAARTALWELDVRDATFANVVSEARRGLARLVKPPDSDEWLARTLNEQLPLHDLVVTDAQLVEQRLGAARLQPPAQAIDTLRPAVEMVRDIPFAGTSYLWPDAEGLTSSLVLLAISAAGELAGHALSVGDIETVFWATGRGLAVLPGHEELIALRMRAHARAGDFAGVRQEWESYERVIVADAWSDGEPAPKLLDLRRELLT